MIAIIAALSREVAGIKSRMKVDRIEQVGLCRCLYGSYRGRQVVLAMSGMGRARAEQAADAVLGACRPEALLSVGYAGGLKSDLRVGEMVICSEAGTLGSFIRCDERLVSICSSGARVGKGITSSSPVLLPSQRRVLALRYGVDIVDMESYWLAARAAASGVPFLSARAVSDSEFRPVPSLDEIVNIEGGLRLPGAFAHPRKLASLPRLFLTSRLATASIAKFMEGFITAL